MHPSRFTPTTIAARVPLGLAVLVVAATVRAAPAPLAVGGAWTGSLSRARRHEELAGSGTLAQRGTQVTGWVVLNVPEMAGEVPVTGAARRRSVVLEGSVGDTRVRAR